ncbi:MAG: hypothetical protein H7125_03850 [Proteobacteria bacterium]|nr:hypothetical protein [Burkholderiales bacterium]
MRIAFVIGSYPPAELEMRKRAVMACASPEVEIGFIQVAATSFIYGIGPAEIQMLAPYYIEAYRRAEQEGYDAAVPLGMLELGVDGGRSAVDIPVVGPCEAALHLAALLGDRFGCIGYEARMRPFMRAIVARHGMAERIAGWKDVGLDNPDLAGKRDQVIASFLNAARSLIDENGAEVIIPMGVSHCPTLFTAQWAAEQLQVPVVDGIGAPIRLAATLASLKLTHSRIRWPKSTSRP